MLRIIYILPLALLCLATRASAQSHTTQDEDYIQRFPGTTTVRIYLGEKASILRLIDRQHDRRLSYYPNNSLSLGGGVTLLGIGLNFGVSLPFHDSKDDKYGDTRALDLQLHRYSPLLMLDGYFQRYKGYHLNTLDDVTAVTSATQYPYFADMKSYTIGASGLYVFNGKHFSLRSLVNQQDWQRKSAGSFLLGASFFWHQWKNPNGLLPDFYKYPDFLDGRQPERINYYGLTVNGGYGYTAVFKRHLFASGAVDGGIGPGYNSVSDTLGAKVNHISLSTTVDGRFGFGYNSTRWFGGAYLIVHADHFGLPYNDGTVTSSQGIFRIVVARRFVTNKKWLQNK